MQFTRYDPDNTFGNTIETLLRQEPFRLQPLQVSSGGVYVFYYTGPFHLYQDIRTPEAEKAIYAGCTHNMGERLGKHCKTIDSVQNLDRADFLCRVLLLPKDWEKTIEARLIDRLKPLWNQPGFKGFGNNEKHPLGGKASHWDTIHPGRKMALGLERLGEVGLVVHAEVHLHKHQQQDCITDLFDT